MGVFKFIGDMMDESERQAHIKKFGFEPPHLIARAQQQTQHVAHQANQLHHNNQQLQHNVNDLVNENNHLRNQINNLLNQLQNLSAHCEQVVGQTQNHIETAQRNADCRDVDGETRCSPFADYFDCCSYCKGYLDGLRCDDSNTVNNEENNEENNDDMTNDDNNNNDAASEARILQELAEFLANNK